MFWMMSICLEEFLLKIWLKSVDFELIYVALEVTPMGRGVGGRVGYWLKYRYRYIFIHKSMYDRVEMLTKT